MTKHEILEKLIPYYEECIKELKEMSPKDNIHRYLYDKHIGEGICHTIYVLYNINYNYSPYVPDWIKRNHQITNVRDKALGLWDYTPSFTLRMTGIEACIKVLQSRVNIMKKELLIHE